MNITYLLELMQRIGKMHEQMLKELCHQYDLSLIEAKMYPRQLIFCVRRGSFQKQQTRQTAGKRIFPCCHHVKMLPKQSTHSSLLFTTICLTDFR